MGIRQRIKNRRAARRANNQALIAPLTSAGEQQISNQPTEGFLQQPTGIQNKVKDFLLNDIVRAFPRAVTTTVQSFKKGEEAKFSDNIVGNIARVLTGADTRTGSPFDRPVYNISGTGRQIAPNASAPKALILGTIFTGLDLIPDFGLGGAAKKGFSKFTDEGFKLFKQTADDVARVIAKSDNELEIADQLRRIYSVDDNTIRRTAKELVGETDPIKIADEIVTDAKKMQGFDPKRFENISKSGAEDLKNFAKANEKAIKMYKAGVLTDASVLEAAKTADVLKDPVLKTQTLKKLSEIQKTKGVIEAKFMQGMTEADKTEVLNLLAKVLSQFTDAGRILRTANDARFGDARLKIMEDILKKADDQEEALRRLADADWTNQEELLDIYKTTIKPSFAEFADEYRYINLLSSPKTHITNTLSNLIQATITGPLLTKLPSGAIDRVISLFKGGAREMYIREVPAYYKGLFNGLGSRKAWSDALEILKGNRATARPDLPSFEKIKSADTRIGKLLQSAYYLPVRLLELGDVVFKEAIQRGVYESLLKRAELSGTSFADESLDAARQMMASGANPNEIAAALHGTEFYDEIVKKSDDEATKLIFRTEFDPTGAKTGQGAVLSFIDGMAESIDQLRNVGINTPFGEMRPGKLLIPFLRTPTQIFKQGLEYSPVGFATIPGAANKTEQFAKAFMGSLITMGTFFALGDDNVTWAPPTNEDERTAFYDSGRKPYSIKIGDRWVSISRLGPIAYPIAMAQAAKWELDNNPRNINDSTVKKLGKVLSGIAVFFSDQSYMQGLSDIVDLTRGESKLSQLASNTATQFIPMSSLLRWTSNIIDPVFRNPKDENFFTETWQGIVRGIPFYSRSVPAYETATGKDSTESSVAGAALFPGSISRINAEGERIYDLYIEQIKRSKQRSGAKDVIKETALEIHKDLSQLDPAIANFELQRLALKDKELADEVASLARAEKATPEQKIILKLTVGDGSRARFIKEEIFDNLPSDAARAQKLQELREAKVITDAVFEQLQRIYAGLPPVE